MDTKLSKYIKINGIICFLSFAFSIFLIELILTIYNYYRPSDFDQRCSIAKKKGVPFDCRTRIQVLENLWSRGIEVYPIIPPEIYYNYPLFYSNGKRIIPLSCISNKLALLGNESGEYIIIRNDKYGFNNPNYSWSQDHVNLLLIGDSFTHGAFVKAGDDIGGQLRRFGKSVINLGMVGDGPLMELATLIEYGTKIKPEIVLWFYFENDLEDLSKESKSVILTNYLNVEINQGLINRQDEIDKLIVTFFNEQLIAENRVPWVTLNNKINWLQFVKGRIKLYSIRSLIGLAPGKWDRPPLILFQHVMKKANDITNAWGGRLYFIYLPSYDSVVNKKRGSDKQNMVLPLIRQLGIPIIDFIDGLSNETDPISFFPLRIKGHYNEKGYRLLAETIITSLKTKYQKFR